MAGVWSCDSSLRQFLVVIVAAMWMARLRIDRDWEEDFAIDFDVVSMFGPVTNDNVISETSSMALRIANYSSLCRAERHNVLATRQQNSLSFDIFFAVDV